MAERSVDVLVAEAELSAAASLKGRVDGDDCMVDVAAEDVVRAIGFPAMVEALAFYANRGVYFYDRENGPPAAIGKDKGERARAVLGGEVQAGSDRSGLGERERAELQRLREFAQYTRGYCSAGSTDDDRHLQAKAERALSAAASTSNDRGDE
jgi:hypothetical protein